VWPPIAADRAQEKFDMAAVRAGIQIELFTIDEECARVAKQKSCGF
jgi:hypothetical protein